MCHNSHTEDRKHARKDARTRTRTRTRTHCYLSALAWHSSQRRISVLRFFTRDFWQRSRATALLSPFLASSRSYMHGTGRSTGRCVIMPGGCVRRPTGTLWNLRPSLVGIYSSTITPTTVKWLKFCKTCSFSWSNDLKFFVTRTREQAFLVPVLFTRTRDQAFLTTVLFTPKRLTAPSHCHQNVSLRHLITIKTSHYPKRLTTPSHYQKNVSLCERSLIKSKMGETLQGVTQTPLDGFFEPIIRF